MKYLFSFMIISLCFFQLKAQDESYDLNFILEQMEEVFEDGILKDAIQDAHRKFDEGDFDIDLEFDNGRLRINGDELQIDTELREAIESIDTDEIVDNLNEMEMRLKKELPEIEIKINDAIQTIEDIDFNSFFEKMGKAFEEFQKSLNEENRSSKTIRI